jgi:nucleotide-binding universal stress UspA family protein
MGPRILVPLDGSETAESILPYVWALLPRVDAEIVLVRSVQPPTATMNGFFPILSASEESARAYLLGIREPFVQAGVSVRLVTRLEGALLSILEEAGHAEASLIAMATHGRTGLSHLLLGGICEGVLRESRIPVLAVRPFRPPSFRRLEAPPKPVFRNVLVPLDSSESSLSILPLACAFARQFDARLVFLHVLDPRKAALAAIGSSERGRARDEAPPLETAAQQCALEGVRSRIVVDSGLVVDRILSLCRREDIDLVAMTTHGRSSLSRFLFGSVSGQVLARAEVPMLLCREP